MKLNTPNKLVLLRFFLAFAVVGLLIAVPYVPQADFLCPTGKTQNILNFVAMGLFIIAAITDFLDGHLARKNNQVTEFGKLFDPIADKILVNSVLIIFACYTRMPIWLAVIFIIRDLAVEGLRMSISSQGKVIAADKWGKWKTIWQFIGLSVLFFSFPDPTATNQFDYMSLYHIAVVPMYIAAFFSILSGFNYFKSHWKDIIK